MRKPGKTDEYLKRQSKRRQDIRNKRMLETERASFEEEVNNKPKLTFRWLNTTKLRWPWTPIHVPKGYVLTLSVVLDVPLPYSVVEAKLEQVFGYLKKKEVTE